MKMLKTLFLSSIILAGFLIAGHSKAEQRNVTSMEMRVRVVPGSADQKKKDAQHPAAPKPAAEAKSNSGFFCEQNNSVKTKLAVANGGSPQ
jgi:hypothetical protein